MYNKNHFFTKNMRTKKNININTLVTKNKYNKSLKKT